MISEAVLQIAIIFVPGIIWAQIDAIYASRRKPTEFEFTINILIFGLVSYAAALLFSPLVGVDFVLPSINREAAGVDLGVQLSNIAPPLMSSLVLAVGWCYFVNYRWFPWIVGCIRASKSIGDQDVWEFTFNSSDPLSKYANIRDYENGLIFTGFVRGWSGSDKPREILLAQAIVYHEDGRELYAMPMMYLSRDADKITIEFPAPDKKG